MGRKAQEVAALRSQSWRLHCKFTQGHTMARRKCSVLVTAENATQEAALSCQGVNRAAQTDLTSEAARMFGN